MAGWRGWRTAWWRCGPEGVHGRAAGPTPGRARMRQGDQSAPADVPGRFDRILHLGNVVVDVVLSVPALPERGSDVVASRAEATAGGGFNVMAAAARQGLRAAYAGAHGTGPFGTLARSALAQEGIEVIQPVKTGLDTGFAITIVE